MCSDIGDHLRMKPANFCSTDSSSLLFERLFGLLWCKTNGITISFRCTSFNFLHLYSTLMVNEQIAYKRIDASLKKAELVELNSREQRRSLGISDHTLILIYDPFQVLD